MSDTLKKILAEHIPETQSTFVAGRQITDNIMISQEMFHVERNQVADTNKWPSKPT